MFAAFLLFRPSVNTTNPKRVALLQSPSLVIIKTELEFHPVSVHSRFMVEITRIIHLFQVYSGAQCWTVTSLKEATCSKEIGERSS